MSFITKRERVFNEYDLFDLPARNEGKLKAYASCTDARAWSHFCSDKSEHLVEIIKRNNETCRPKYVPTEAIVNTLLANKHSEIARLKRKIEEFEQMLAVYDDLDLTNEQKCEIAKAHAAIKEANKDLNELCFDLDLSGFTGIDSEDFETGKSRGDEPSKYKEEQDEETPRSKGDEWSFEKEPPLKETKISQTVEINCYCDASTNAVDPRIEEMQESLICKDAKLNAMKNSMAVMENDVCEPYCIYAHIYTALEKIFGILCQNDKYKLYLDLMTSGKNIRYLDIKGKILFKLKVLEKFNIALIAPCSQDFASRNAENSRDSDQECACYRAEGVPRVETAYALTSAESQHPTLDNKRAHLVADIMEYEEMKDILRKESDTGKTDVDTDEDIVLETYNIDQENLNRIKNLQENYDELMNLYEALKVEKNSLVIRCRKYEELEKEVEDLQAQLREYNALWNEKEHYRKRSVDLDTLKEQYLILCDETTNLETELKAELEINDVKTRTIEELRNENIALEKRLNDATIAFEKEKNCARCKISESECTIMCQGQQIKSLTLQVDKLLEQDPDGAKQSETPAIVLINEINSLKDQLKNLQDALFGSEEEKQQLQEEYQNKLNIINTLRIEIEDWRSNYEKTLQRNEYLEKYTESFREEVNKLIEENQHLSQDIITKSIAIENLMDMNKNKSQEVNKLMEDVENKNREINNLNYELHALDTQKSQAIKSLQLSKKESHELIEKVKDYDEIIHQKESITHAYQQINERYEQLEALLVSTQEEKESLLNDLASRNNDILNLMQKNQRLQDDIRQYGMSLDVTKKDSKILEDKFHNQMQQLKESHEKLLNEKSILENELANKTDAIQLTKEECLQLQEKLQDSVKIQADLENEQRRLQSELNKKKRECDDLLNSFNKVEAVNDETSQNVKELLKELASLKKLYDTLLAEKEVLQNDFDVNTDEIKRIYKNLESKMEENRALIQQLKSLESDYKTVQNNMSDLQKEHCTAKNTLNSLIKENNQLFDKVKYHEILQLEFDRLKKEHDQVKADNFELANELDMQKTELKRLQKDNLALNSESQHLLSHSEDLEKALINARTQLIVSTSSTDNSHIDILKQIDEMKKEKLAKHEEIRNLLDKLEESENVISTLSEDINGRDVKISILENHINELKNEVNRLHSSLAEIIDTGEQIKENSYQKIRDSLHTMEAHHSKATHNMKIELAKLQSDNIALEERLSVGKIKSEDLARDKYKYVSQIAHLQNERDIIVTDIKQLELSSVGDSVLSPENCRVEEVLRSLDRIRQYLDARSSKSSSLEQTLLKVQNSYQVVQNKADEAKRIVEKEKQKILNEKEEAIRDRQYMEKQLTDLKEQLEKQVSHDKNVIKDLEAEILNQKLICDKLNNSTQCYILKLEGEMQSLQDVYDKSLGNIAELEKQLNLMTADNKSNLNIIKEVNVTLEGKNKEIRLLKNEINDLKNKKNHSQGIQVLVVNKNDEVTQTNEEVLYDVFDDYYDTKKIKPMSENEEFNSIYTEKSTNYESDIPQKEKRKLRTEVQVLTASIEPTFNYVRDCYLNYKLKHLSFGPLEYESYSGTGENNIEQSNKETNALINDENKNQLFPNRTEDERNVIDIYNKQSIHTNSSKNLNSNYPYNDKDIKSPRKTSAITDLGLTFDSFDTKSSSNKASNLFGSVSGISTDKDLFVIYRDSETNQNLNNQNKSLLTTGQSAEIVETVTVRSDKDIQKLPKKDNNKNKQKKHATEKDLFMYLENEELTEDDSVKRKLTISLPRVETDTTVENTSDGDKKSEDSYILNIYRASKSTHSSEKQTENSSNIRNKNRKASIDYDKTQYPGPQIFTKYENKVSKLTDKNNFINSSGSMQLIGLSTENNISSSDFEQIRFENISRNTLSVIDVDFSPVETKTVDLITQPGIEVSDDTNIHRLNYIQTSEQIDPDNTKMYNATNFLRKSRSDEQYNLAKFQENSETTPKTNQSFINTQTKTYTEKSINTMDKLDTNEDYETKLKCLTENIKKHYEKKIDAMKMQYDNHIKNILKDHNEGVKSIQGLHEDTLQDIIRHHENEVENLRSMSIEAMRKADKLEKECRCLKRKLSVCGTTCLDDVYEPVKNVPTELKRLRKSRLDSRTLTKTKVEAFNVRPKSRSNGPCTCSLDINISDTIRTIFEQVDIEHSKKAEHTYLKYIANKMLHDSVEALDCHELSFLHLKVCRIWKNKVTKEDILQKKIDSLEAELMSKHWGTQKNKELDREVAEGKRRLQEARDAICRNVPIDSTFDNLEPEASYVPSITPPTPDKDFFCSCNTTNCNMNVSERRSAGDLSSVANSSGLRPKRTKHETNRTLAKIDGEERRERRKKEEDDKKLYTDELPTRLRRHPTRFNRK